MALTFQNNIVLGRCTKILNCQKIITKNIFNKVININYLNVIIIMHIFFGFLEVANANG